jgi:hypothetical protein
MSKNLNALDEYRRFVGYLLLTFMSVFIYFPLIWFLNLFGSHVGLYRIWVAVSGFIVIFNLLFYQVRIPKKLMQNISIVAVIDLIMLVVEYVLLFNSE